MYTSIILKLKTDMSNPQIDNYKCYDNQERISNNSDKGV